MSTYTSLILAESSLTNYWELQETSGTTATDAKAANNGTYNAGYTLNQAAPANLGASVTFNGTSSQATIPAESIPGPMSIELWLRFNAADVGQNGFLVLKKPVNGQWELFLEGSTLKLRGASSGSTVTATAPVDSSWHHVVGTISGTTGTIYIDGATRGSGTVTAIANGTTAGTNDLLLGNHGAGGYYYKGDLCHVALYSAVLTAAQVASHYTAGAAALPLTVGSRLKSGRPRLRRGNPMAAGLAAAWKWPGGYGQDLVGTAHLAPQGAVSYDGRLGLNTNVPNTTTGCEVICPPALRLALPITVVWAGTQLGTPRANSSIFGCSYDNVDVSPYAAWELFFNAANTYSCGTNGSGSFWQVSSGIGSLPSGSPLWLAATIDTGFVMSIYVNTPEVHVDATHSGAVAYGANPLVFFGELSYNSAYSPMVAHDYGLVFNRVLTQAELRKLYTHGDDLFAGPRGHVGWAAALQAAQVVAGNPAALLPAM